MLATLPWMLALCRSLPKPCFSHVGSVVACCGGQSHLQFGEALLMFPNCDCVCLPWWRRAFARACRIRFTLSSCCWCWRAGRNKRKAMGCNELVVMARQRKSRTTLKMKLRLPEVEAADFGEPSAQDKETNTIPGWGAPRKQKIQNAVQENGAQAQPLQYKSTGKT